MLEYVLFALPSYLIARPKEYLRSALAYCAGVVGSYAFIVLAGTVLHVSGKQLDDLVGQMFLLPLVGVGIAWFTKEPRVNTAVDVSSTRVRFGMFVGWLFNAAALLILAVAGAISVNRTGPLSQSNLSLLIAILPVAGTVWLLGRGLRYVLVGPPQGTRPTPRADASQLERASLASLGTGSTAIPMAAVSKASVPSLVVPSGTSMEPSTPSATQSDTGDPPFLSREWFREFSRALLPAIIVVLIWVLQRFGPQLIQFWPQVSP